MNALTLTKVCKNFGAATALRDADLAVTEGELVVFVGPSGCGKSTLLRMIAGLETVSSGTIHIQGTDVTHAAPSARKVAMVFQSYALYPHMTVEENLTFGLRMRGVARDVMAQKTAMATRMLQLDGLLTRKPATLSGGQCQRVAIGRALVQEPAIFLLDEPLSNLDAELRASTRIELAALHKALGKTMIYVTHDQTEAMTLADRIVVLRQGQIEQIGTPLQLYARPANLFVAGFMGQPAINVFAVRTSTDGQLTLSDGTALALPAGVSPSGIAQLGIRPEHIVLDTTSPHRATVSAVEHLGTHCYVHAKAKFGHVCVNLREVTTLRAGADIGVRFDVGPLHYFDARGVAVRAD